MRPIVTDLGIALWRLLPANPIVTRVVYTGGKRTRHLWVRAAYLLTLLGVLLLLWLQTGSGGSLADVAKKSTQVFKYISILQLALMCFLAPIFTAGAITQERDAETFNVLLTTPLTNAQIVLGSLLSRLYFVVMLLLSGLPIFCITMLFGGVTAQQIFLSFGIAGCTAVLTGSLAISISVMRQGNRSTIFSFYMLITAYLLTGLVLGKWHRTYVKESVIPGVNEGMSWLAPFHPYLAMEVALNHNEVAPPEAAAVAHYIWPLNRFLAAPQSGYMFMTLFVSAVLVGLSTFFVRRGIRQGEQTPWARWWKSRTREGGEQLERRRRARRVWSNPVAWREAVTRGSAASGDFVRYSYMICGGVALVGLLWAYTVGEFNTSEARGALTAIVLIEFISVLLMAANTAATAITREREAGTMELMLTTPLTSRYIVWGKLRGLVSFTVPLMAVPMLTVLLVAVWDFRSPTPIVEWPSVLLLPLLLMVYSAFACVLGLQMSLRSRGSIQALLATIGILLVVGLGLGFCGAGLVSTGPLGPVMIPLTFVTAVLYVLNPDQMTLAGGWKAGDVLALQVLGTAIALGLYGAIVTATYRSMISNFDMIVRKQQR